jgi:NAD(P)-dependent dehydrogenase (short-subunit alcohol dehydrogenase family)
MTTYQDLKNRTILITGGANGLGEAMVRAFASQGSSVHFCDIDTLKGAAVAAETGSLFTEVDISDPEAAAVWIDTAASLTGSVDCLVNNAARDPRIDLADTTVDQWDRLVALNIRSQYFAAQAVVPHMRANAGATIINFSSITALLGQADVPAYVATKSATIGLTRSLANILGKEKGIRVNTITPGAVMTERQLAEIVTPETKRMLSEVQAIPDLVQPDEIADVALFLASSASRAITGQQMLTDHGWHFI